MNRIGLTVFNGRIELLKIIKNSDSELSPKCHLVSKDTKLKRIIA